MLGVAVVGAIALSACGGSSSSSRSNSGQTKQGTQLFKEGVDIRPKPSDGSTNPDVGTKPVRGGKLTYALEAEDTNGYCLPEGQLDISGEQVVRAVYDTLTIPGKDGKYHPYLAESVTASPDNMTWTIKLRDGITFSDGTPLNATVVKNNLDAYRGTYAARKPLLFIFVFQNIASTTVVDDKTVEVKMKQPWIDFDAALFGQNRVGIMGQSQLDDTKSCATKLVGTGPFVLDSWKVNERYIFKPNKNYWQKAPDGKPYPYLDELDYVPIPDGGQRISAVESGTVDGSMQSGGKFIEQARADAEQGKARVVTSVVNTELPYILLNSTKAPFNNASLRKAAAEALDVPAINKLQDKGVAPVAYGPFAPGSPGYLQDPGYPTYNPADAKKLVAAWSAANGGQKPKVALTSTPDADTIKLATFYQNYLKAAGFDATIANKEQSELINTAVGKDFQALLWRNHGGVKPDEQYIWWHSGSPVNFGGINDPVIDCLLEVGRSGASAQACLKNDPSTANISPTDQTAIYQALNKRFGSQVWNLWAPQYSPWTVHSQPYFHGIFGPNLPDGSAPWQGLLNGIPALGLYKTTGTTSS